MFTKYSYLIVIFYCANGVLSNTSITSCQTTDEACLDKSLQAAVQQGITKSDPLFVEKVDGNLSILKYELYNSTVTGFKSCSVSMFKLNSDLKQLFFKLDCPKVNMNGEYEMDGRLIIIPVKGVGAYTLQTGKYSLDITCELKHTTNSDGKTVLSIKNFKLKCNPLSGNRYEFKNLFNGQKDLSDAVHKFAHENWMEVQEFVQYPTWYSALKKVINNINKELKANLIINS